jgi:hypothetical protein
VVVSSPPLIPGKKTSKKSAQASKMIFASPTPLLLLLSTISLKLSLVNAQPGQAATATVTQTVFGPAPTCPVCFDCKTSVCPPTARFDRMYLMFVRWCYEQTGHYLVLPHIEQTLSMSFIEPIKSLLTVTVTASKLVRGAEIMVLVRATHVIVLLVLAEMTVGHQVSDPFDWR